MRRISFSIVGIALLLLLLFIAPLPTQAAAGFNKANFHHPLAITNQYFPLVTGTTFVYDGKTGNKSTHEEMVVTNQTRMILGVDARVVHDSNWENGKLVEDTFDWYAQDDAGNVWYLGEDTTQYKNRKVIGHEGSWEGGVNGAVPGILMEARPKEGDTFQQEYSAGVAEDMSTILSLDQSICVPYGCFSHVLETKDFSPLEPGIVEHKYFAPGVGQIKTIVIQGESEETHLVDIITR